MAESRHVVIVGGGHNGLVTAFYLAKAGFKPLVLERRPTVGGAAVTEELHSGFKCSVLAHNVGPICRQVARDMRLERHGLEMLHPEPVIFAPAPDGRYLALFAEPSRSAAEIAKFSPPDAAHFADFHRVLARMGKVLGQVLHMAPPSIDAPATGDLIKLLLAGKDFRGLGKKDMFRLLRWGPMAVADLAAEWFETELLRAIVAARGIFGTAMGPWSAGSSTVFLLRAASDPYPPGSYAVPRGGTGALTQAMAAAATAAGAEIRTNAGVSQILAKDGVVTGVALENGEEIHSSAVVSNADPRRTLLHLLDPAHLEPDFIVKLRNYRCAGTSAKVNLALSGLPSFHALKSADGGGSLLAGRIHIGPEIDYLERAFDSSKYGEFSAKPYLDATIPSLADPSLAPEGKHVMSVYMQFAPYCLKAGWDGQREALADVVVNTLAEYAPSLPSLIEARQVITPLDLEQSYSLTGGHIFQGELALDQLFTMRPLLGWARYSTPIHGLYLCGSGTHPGDGLTGASGANAAGEIRQHLRK